MSGDHLLDTRPLLPRKNKAVRCCISLCTKSSCCLKICLRQPFMTPTAKQTLSLLCSHFSLYFQFLWMAISLCQLLHAPEGFKAVIPPPFVYSCLVLSGFFFFSLVFRTQKTPSQNCPFLTRVVDENKNSSGINFSVQRV